MHFVERRKVARVARQLGRLYRELSLGSRQVVVLLKMSCLNSDWLHDEHALAPGSGHREGYVVLDFPLVRRTTKLKKKSFSMFKKPGNFW